jgi:hypothetical protein
MMLFLGASGLSRSAGLLYNMYDRKAIALQTRIYDYK